jgi:sugar phosphate permease
VALGGAWWTFALLLIPAGMLCAPSLTASADVITGLAPEHARGVVTGLQATAMTLGTAVATPLSGAVIDAASPAVAVLVVGSACVLVAGVAALLHRTVRPGFAATPTAGPRTGG